MSHLGLPLLHPASSQSSMKARKVKSQNKFADLAYLAYRGYYSQFPKQSTSLLGLENWLAAETAKCSFPFCHLLYRENDQRILANRGGVVNIGTPNAVI